MNDRLCRIVDGTLKMIEMKKSRIKRMYELRKNTCECVASEITFLQSFMHVLCLVFKTVLGVPVITF